MSFYPVHPQGDVVNKDASCFIWFLDNKISGPSLYENIGLAEKQVTSSVLPELHPP